MASKCSDKACTSPRCQMDAGSPLVLVLPKSSGCSMRHLDFAGDERPRMTASRVRFTRKFPKSHFALNLQKPRKTVWKLPRTQWLGTPSIAPASPGEGIARGRCYYDVVLPGLNGSRHLFPDFIVSQIIGRAVLEQILLLQNQRNAELWSADLEERADVCATARSREKVKNSEGRKDLNRPWLRQIGWRSKAG